MLKMFPIAFATLATATLFSAVSAPARAESMSVAVPYGDLDLGSPAGVETLNDRVESAIRTICGRGKPYDLQLHAAYKQCTSQAKSSASPQVTAAIMGARNEAFASLDRLTIRK